MKSIVIVCLMLAGCGGDPLDTSEASAYVMDKDSLIEAGSFIKIIFVPMKPDSVIDATLIFPPDSTCVEVAN